MNHVWYGHSTSNIDVFEYVSIKKLKDCACKPPINKLARLSHTLEKGMSMWLSNDILTSVIMSGKWQNYMVNNMQWIWLDNLSDHTEFCSALFRPWFDMKFFKLKNFNVMIINWNWHVAGLNKRLVKQWTCCWIKQETKGQRMGNYGNYE